MSAVRQCLQLGRGLLRSAQQLRPAASRSPLLAGCRTLAIDAGTQSNIEKLVKHSKVVVFMKGEKDSPRCGFSNAVTQILRMHGVEYDGVNVLEDEQLRQGIKEFSQWPTIPQIFVDGEFVGGCDILLQMHQNGELVSLLKKVGIESQLADAVAAEQAPTKKA